MDVGGNIKLLQKMILIIMYKLCEKAAAKNLYNNYMHVCYNYVAVHPV